MLVSSIHHYDTSSRIFVSNLNFAGCIPIYYGPDLIFNIFNRNSFVFYNISNPTPALRQIKQLQNNKEKMKEMKNTKILFNGKATLQKYFSFTDEIGGGNLKKILREKIGL